MRHAKWLVLLAFGCSVSEQAPEAETTIAASDPVASGELATGDQDTTDREHGESTIAPTAPLGGMSPGTAPPAATVQPVAGTGLESLFEAFVKSPDRASWLAVREGIVSSGAYDPYSDEMSLANDLISAGRHAAAVEKLTSAMPNLLLSPSAHQMLAHSYEELKDEASAAAERKAAEACLTGLMATGNGTQDSPWQVSRTSDEYDVLAHLEKRMQQQALVIQDGRHFDRLECSDGSEVWFDVTTAFETLGLSLP